MVAASPEETLIGPEALSHPDSIWCLDRYFNEINRRFPDGFDRDAGGAPDDSIYAPPTGAFLLARAGDLPVGCGGVAFREGYAEIKRMWVCDDARGQGLGYRLLLALEEAAVQGGFTRLRLDSNNTLVEAQKLYRRAGYAEIARYNDNPYAQVWFEKTLGD
jgi:GNAT superfamily N-acetyltransferase